MFQGMLGIRGEPIEAGNSVVLSCTFTFMIKEVSMGCRRKALWQHMFYSLAHPIEKKSQRKGQGKFMVAKNRFQKNPSAVVWSAWIYKRHRGVNFERNKIDQNDPFLPPLH